jgi:hypothetical protein
MLSKSPGAHPHGPATAGLARPRSRRKLRRLADAAGLLLVAGFACLGGWLGTLAGVWVGRTFGLLRLSLSTGLTAGAIAGLALGGIVTLAARGRRSAPRRRAQQPRVEGQREQVR